MAEQYFFLSYFYKKITLGKFEMVKLVNYIKADSAERALVLAFENFTNSNPLCENLGFVKSMSQEEFDKGLWRNDPDIGFTGGVEEFEKNYREKERIKTEKQVAKLKKQQQEYYENLTNNILEMVSWM